MSDHQERYVSRDDRVAVTWEPKLCIAAGFCMRGLPDVFGSKQDMPLERAEVDDIVRVIHQCPTSALSYERLDGGPQEQVPETLEVRPQRNGPLWVRGEVTIFDERGEPVRTMKRVALCRCGHSENKPFCDDSHSRMGFRTTPKKTIAVTPVDPS